MSSTRRSHARYNHKHDYYVTPFQVVYDAIVALRELEPNLLSGPILDPCAGGDPQHEMPYPTVLERFVGSGKVATVDIRDDSRAELVADYLSLNLAGQFHLIITNPPFALADQIVQKALSEVRPGGFVVMLLRLNYFGGQKRRPFWRKHMPKHVLVHPRRISFTDDGRTDSIEYMHACWQEGYDQPFTNLRVL